MVAMKTLTVRLPDRLAAEIESESAAAGISKSDLVRRRLDETTRKRTRGPRRTSFFDLAGDLIGSVTDDASPKDVSAQRKRYLKKWGYGKEHRR